MAAERPVAGVRTVNNVMIPRTIALASHLAKERSVEQTAAAGPAESATQILCVKMILASALNVFLTVSRFAYLPSHFAPPLTHLCNNSDNVVPTAALRGAAARAPNSQGA